MNQPFEQATALACAATNQQKYQVKVRGIASVALLSVVPFIAAKALNEPCCTRHLVKRGKQFLHWRYAGCRPEIEAAQVQVSRQSSLALAG